MDNLDDRLNNFLIDTPAILNRRKYNSDEDWAPRQWPDLEHLHLSADHRSDRCDKIGGSDANIILSGDAERIRQLWREKRGEAEPADLTGNLAVMLGCWTEPFNRQWYEKLTGKRIVDSGKVFVCTRHDWRSCTLDGLVEQDGAVFEAKHTNGFAKPDEVVERYMPQLQHNMAVAGCSQAVLSVIFGNHKFEIFEIAADWLYQIELLTAEQRFWTCVQTGEEPVAVEPIAAPRPIGTREICFEGNNAWASAAFDWLTHREAAKLHACACASIKSLIAEDVARAFGHGIEAKRSKSGAITIRESAE
ncbi:MAG: YqaJ viral recombinase family protein [Sphingomicrobium sp.]